MAVADNPGSQPWKAGSAVWGRVSAAFAILRPWSATVATAPCCRVVPARANQAWQVWHQRTAISLGGAAWSVRIRWSGRVSRREVVVLAAAREHSQPNAPVIWMLQSRKCTHMYTFGLSEAFT